MLNSSTTELLLYFPRSHKMKIFKNFVIFLKINEQNIVNKIPDMLENRRFKARLL